MVGKLVRQQIIKRIEQENIITSYNIDECVKPASYEMRVGGYRDSRTNHLVPLALDQQIAIAPQGFVLISTLEQVNIPTDLLGMMYLRSTYARRGFTPWFQGIVDPGYKGALTVILHNLTNRLVELKGGERICHLVLEELPEAVDKGYEGAYQGSEGGAPAVDQPQTVPIIGQAFSEVGSSGSDSVFRTLEELSRNNPQMFMEMLKRILY